MIILRQRKFSIRNKIIGGTSLILGGALIGTINKNKLSGKEIRYHNTSSNNVNSILVNGLKTEYSTDPENLTNKSLKNIPLKDKEGLVYLSKSKDLSDAVGYSRTVKNGLDPSMASKYNKTLKLELDYDKDYKKYNFVKNPELRGASSAEEYYNIKRKLKNLPKEWKDLTKSEKQIWKKAFYGLNNVTETIKNDIPSSKFIGGKGYKSRTVKDTLDYIKNNPYRFGKEAAKIGIGSLLTGYGIRKLLK